MSTLRSNTSQEEIGVVVTRRKSRVERSLLVPPRSWGLCERPQESRSRSSPSTWRGPQEGPGIPRGRVGVSGRVKVHSSLSLPGESKLPYSTRRGAKVTPPGFRKRTAVAEETTPSRPVRGSQQRKDEVRSLDCRKGPPRFLDDDSLDLVEKERRLTAVKLA